MPQNNDFDIRKSINNDLIIGFSNTKSMQALGFLDSAKVSSYMMDGQESSRKHLGMINLFKTTHNVGVPFMRDLFKNASVLEIMEGESITYDLPVHNKETKCYTVQDTSDYTENPGVDNSVFKLALSFEFGPGDILTYDPQYGQQVTVSSDHPVERQGDSFIHYVTYNTNDKTASFPKEQLRSGIQWMKIGQVSAEFDESFSGISMISNPAGSIRCEFVLGDPRGVETAYTAKASRMKATPGLSSFTSDMKSRVDRQLEALGGKDRNMFFYGKKTPTGEISNYKIGTTLEYLAMMELSLMECHSLLFARAATITSSKGSKRVNEGVWHQIRRGKLISYSRPGGITKDHLQEAAAYVFGNTDIPTMDRILKFKGGHFAYQNVLQIFREEAVSQLGSIPAGMLGVDKQIPETVFQGKLNGLEMKPVVIDAVTMPGIGKVVIEHDPSLDYQPMSDRFSAGMFGEGFAHTAYSLVMWDVTDQEYSNVNTSKRVKGANVIKDGNKSANIYYVKPEGAHLTYGYNQGRMAHHDNPFDVMATTNHMGSTFWAYSQSAALVLDTTRYVVIELDRNTMKRR